MPGWAPAATFGLVETAARLGRQAGTTVHVGPIVTGSLFYDPDTANVPRWARLGHLGIEMEAAMLYTIAAVHRIEALAMMTVSDILGATEDDRERISDAQLRQGVDAMMRIACNVAISSPPANRPTTEFPTASAPVRSGHGWSGRAAAVRRRPGRRRETPPSERNLRSERGD